MDNTESVSKSGLSEGSSRLGIILSLGAYALSIALLIWLAEPLQAWNLRIGLLVSELGMVLAPALILFFLSRHNGDSFFKIPEKPFLTLIASIGLGILALIAAALLTVPMSLLIKRFFPSLSVTEDIAQAMRALYGSATGIDVVIGLFLSALLPAFCEEFLFRALIQGNLSRSMNPRLAVLFTAILFGAFHLSVERFVGTFVIGLIAGSFALRKKSLWPAVIIHFTNNAISGLIGLAAFRLGT